jgi:hypothetical protein
VTIALFAVALLTVGCGSGGGSGSSSEPVASGSSSSSSQLIAKADAICRRLNTELARLESKGLSTSEIAGAVPAHVTLERAALQELSKLTPPAALAGDWRQVIADRQTLAEELVELGRVARTNDAARIRALAVSKKRTHGALHATATRAGFKDCSQVG